MLYGKKRIFPFSFSYFVYLKQIDYVVFPDLNLPEISITDYCLDSPGKRILPTAYSLISFHTHHTSALGTTGNFN